MTGGGELRAMSILGEITVEMLKETFPEWRVYEGRGWWWAVCDGVARLDGAESLLKRVLASRMAIQDQSPRMSPVAWRY